MLQMSILLISLVYLRLEMMPFILILSLLLSKVLLQLIYLGFDLNRLLSLLLLFQCDLIMHVLAYVSDASSLLLALPPCFISVLLDLLNHRGTPIHLSIHRFNDLLCLLDGLLLHLQLLFLVFRSLLELQTLFLLDLETVKEISFEYFKPGSGIFLLQELTVYHFALEGKVLLFLVGLVVQVSDVVVTRPHLV